MAKRKPNPLQGSWIDAIAAESGRPSEMVADFLDRHDIRAQGIIPRPVDLTIRRLTFGGIKDLDGQVSPLEFIWDELTPGVCLIGSGRNSRGKTSLLAIMRWLLRGTPPKSLPSDVRDWIYHATMDFDLDDLPHRVSIDLRNGFQASLFEVGREGRPILEAKDEAHFESAMSDFMLRTLSLEPITSLRRDRDPDKGGRTIHHRWPALFSAFHIGTSYSALIGDVVHDGLVNRMLNMFAGFPHAVAVAQIGYVIAGLEMGEEQENRATRAIAEHAKERGDRLRAELKSLRAKVIDVDLAAELFASIRSISNKLTQQYERLPEARRRLDEAERLFDEAKADWNADRLALQNFNEDRAATRVFRTLNPKCCPRCDRSFGPGRKDRERELHACMVCGEAAPEEDDEGKEQAKARLVENVQISAQIHASTMSAVLEAQETVGAAKKCIASLEEKLEAERERQRATHSSQDDVTRCAVLEAMIADADADAKANEARPETDEAAIAKACDKVFRHRLKDEQAEILDEVRSEVLALLRSLGVVNLADVTLNTVPHLALIKGKKKTAFSDAVIGDKLRAKIALIVALMKVGHRRGIGSHPGLLFIDTPGAQETSDEDLAALSTGLAALCQELPTLQIFVATQRVAAFEKAVAPACRLVVSGDDILW